MEYLLIGGAVAFNIIILLWKFRHHRWLDGLLDTSALTLVGMVFAGSLGSLIIGTIGSLIISLYLMIFPPILPSFKPKRKRSTNTFKPQLREILW